MRSGALRVVLVGALPAATGCDPILNLYGSFFPAWVVCLLAGIVLTVLLRFLFVALDLEDGFQPLLLVYPALVFLLACGTWLALFRG